MDNVPSMSKEARKARQEAWQEGNDLGAEFARDARAWMADETLRIELFRGIGQYFNALAHDLTQQQQKENT